MKSVGVRARGDGRREGERERQSQEVGETKGRRDKDGETEAEEGLTNTERRDSP